MKFASLLSGRRAGLTVLAIVLAGLILGQYLTRGAGNLDTVTAPATSAGLVDQSPLVTARRLAAEAYDPAEQQEAAQALRVADHEVDQAFATALRDATSHATPLKGEALSVSQKISAMEARVEAEKQRLAALTKVPVPSSSPSKKQTPIQEDAASESALVQAQLDLDNDQLEDLHQDLIRLGGDKHAKIQQALDEHESVQKQAVALPQPGTDANPESPQNLQDLPGKFHALSELGQRRRNLSDARAEALQATGDLTRQHKLLEKQAEIAVPTQTGADTAATTIKTLRTLSGQRKALIEYDSRVHDEQQLASIYQSWEEIAAQRRLSILHRVFIALAVICLFLLLALAATLMIRAFFARRVDDRRRLGHLRIIAELAVQVLALAIILIVIFGPPKQMPAIIGLATAGVTIVLKDFIVAFFGWFPLMGKNGIRVGDWVEINGVSGEVVEIGMLRTVLLETGNWADSGHPTGRRVTFMNSFAIEGRYFNFSTSGQWLWDELRVTVPNGENTYDRIEAIRELVNDSTQQDAEVAEQEWRKATKDEALRGFSAAPGVDLRPAGDGIEVTVRYITRAQKRYEVRSNLYQAVIRAMSSEIGPERRLPSM